MGKMLSWQEIKLKNILKRDTWGGGAGGGGWGGGGGGGGSVFAP
jgi:hypothetical protein